MNSIAAARSKDDSSRSFAPLTTSASLQKWRRGCAGQSTAPSRAAWGRSKCGSKGGEPFMPEIDFTIDAQTGEMEMKVEGVQGPQCADVAKIVTELTGAPQQEENTKEYYVRPNVRPQIQNKKL